MLVPCGSTTHFPGGPHCRLRATSRWSRVLSCCALGASGLPGAGRVGRGYPRRPCHRPPEKPTALRSGSPATAPGGGAQPYQAVAGRLERVGPTHVQGAGAERLQYSDVVEAFRLQGDTRAHQPPAAPLPPGPQGTAGHDQHPRRPPPGTSVGPQGTYSLGPAWAVGTVPDPAPWTNPSAASTGRPSGARTPHPVSDSPSAKTPATGETHLLSLDTRHVPGAASRLPSPGIPARCPSARGQKQRVSGDRLGEGGVQGCAHEKARRHRRTRCFRLT